MPKLRGWQHNDHGYYFNKHKKTKSKVFEKNKRTIDKKEIHREKPEHEKEFFED